ncbi:hypothetical protein THOM_2842 [Trachipleistophora hominis]|uniref:Zinc-ribbon 15 domain-containing protein n=1 Tax=Trachipleistophora hominis TaxID=72359 RepID=L7JSG7_TRAHO|nr:hypothetical protein THOM_2842 [Trachipleistophora hominis]
MCNCMICGLTSRKITKRNENGVIDVYCPHCSNTVTSCTIYEKYYFSFFFIPLCPVKTKKKYAGCGVCKIKFSDGRVRVCSKCRSVVLNSYRYCGRCGDEVSYQ